MAIPAINVLGNPNVTEGNFQIAIEDLRKSVIGSGKAYDAANTYSQYDTCVSGGIVYYSKINSNTGNTPAINANWGLIGDLFNLLITNGTALGYGTGSGGSVTQLTSKSTAVMLNKPVGSITTSNSALPANSTVFFQFNNTFFNYPNDLMLLTCSNPSNYSLTVGGGSTGYTYIAITNKTTGSLSETIAINFTVTKGANS